MPDFKTPQLSSPNTNFSPLPARAPADVSRKVDQAIADVASVGLEMGGKAYARSRGAKVTGADMTLEEVNDTASAIDDEIQQALAAEENAVEGPLSAARAAELKDAALSRFATNDRTLKALRDQGVISTTEARARRTMNLQRELSNPINNLFRKDFLNAAGDLTGGGRGAVDAMFEFTAEEQEAMAIQEAQRKAKAEYEGAVTDAMLRTGQSRDVVVAEFQQDEMDKQRVDELNRLKTERELNQIEAEELFARSRSGLARGVADRINSWHMESGGKGLQAAQVAQGTQMIEQQYQTLLEQVNSTPGITGAARDAEQARLEKWKQGQQALLKAYDAAELDKATLEQMNMAAKKLGWSAMPELMALNAINPKYMELFVKSGGRLDDILNLTVGGDRGTRFIQATKLIGTLENMENGGPLESKPAAIQMFDSNTGMEMLAEQTADPNSKVSDSLKRIYADAPDYALKTFNGISGRAAAVKSPEIRAQVSDAMSIAKQKMDFMLSTKGAGGEVTAEASPARMTAQGMRSNRVYLDMPEGMEEHKNELTEIYRTIEKHDWMWKYVSEAYQTPADAFNGYMRGEWVVDLSPDNTGPDQGVGRIEAEVPVQRQELSPEQADEFRLARPRPEDVAELQELLAKEAEGTPTEQEEARLSELLEQRIAIRDRRREGGKPLDPRPDLGEPAPIQGTTGPSFESLAPEVLKFEGGFQANPDDRGNYYKGELIGTNMGISAAQYKSLFGSEPTKEKLEALTEEQVKKAYKEKYWDKNKIDQMPEAVREIAFNMFIMTSPKNAIKALQRASGAKEDGILGPKTLKALRGTTKEEIWEEYHAYLKSLKNYDKFGRGWRNRYEQILQG